MYVPSSLMDPVSLAILPITVLSPVLTTSPVQVPSTALVEKKARFFVSRGLSCEKTGILS